MEDKELEAGLQDLRSSEVHDANFPVERAIDEKSEKWQIRQFLASEIRTKYVYIPMLVCCLITGFIDGTLYNGKQSSRSNEVRGNIAKSIQ